MNFKKGHTPWNKNKRCPQLDNNTNGFQKGQIPWNKNINKEIDERLLKAAQKLSKSLKGNQNNKGKHWKLSELTRKKFAEVSKRRWQNPCYKEKTVKAIMKAICKSPNNSEQSLNMYLTKILPNEYQFVGNGQFILGGKCPDFINMNGQKKIIELYGEHWHDAHEEQERIEYFKHFGYSSLIIWTKELTELEKLRDTILKFNLI